METTFSISITTRQYLAYYQGGATHVELKDDFGRHLQIHARHFRSFISPSGINGRFKLRLDPNRKFVDLVRL